MNKFFKYSLVTIESPEDEVIHEIFFEDPAVINKEDQRIFTINQHQVRVKIAAVTKVNHIDSPNDVYDYRLLGVSMK